MRVNALQNYREKISTSDMCHNRMCVCVCEKNIFTTIKQTFFYQKKYFSIKI